MIIYNKYNLAFVLSDSNSKKEFEGYRYVLNNLECQVLYSDYNCEIYKSLISKRIHFLYKKIKFNKQKYFRNPLYIFVDFMKVLTRKV